MGEIQKIRLLYIFPMEPLMTPSMPRWDAQGVIPNF